MITAHTDVVGSLLQPVVLRRELSGTSVVRTNEAAN